MATINLAGAINKAAFKLGLWSYRRPTTRRAYNAAADAVGRSMKKMLGNDYKYYREGEIREDIVRTISEMQDLKTTVIYNTSIADRKRFAETGYVNPRVSRMIEAGPDLNVKTAMLSRMSLKDLYQRFYDWNKTQGVKAAVIERRNWVDYQMHGVCAVCGPYQDQYKGIFYSSVIFHVQLLVDVLKDLPPRHKATKLDLDNVRTAVEIFKLNSVLGYRSLDQWYGEFYREPTKNTGGSIYPMISVGNELLRKADPVGQPENIVGVLTRMIPVVAEEKVAHLSENEAKEKVFEPLNEYLRFVAWFPSPEKATVSEMEHAFIWVLPSNRGWIFGRKDVTDMGITMIEYANVGLEMIREEAAKTPV